MGWFEPLNPCLRDWSGRRVWIVGASSGIGAALAQLLLARGAQVAVSARRAQALEEVVQGHAGAFVLPLDVCDPARWADAVAALQARWSGVDLVVFCAAQYQPERAWEVRPAGAASVIETNLTSVYYGLAALLPQMLERGSGSLALVASVAGYTGLPKATVYGPTKAALINLAQTLYFDLRPRGLGVFLVNPGFVQTPLTARNNFRMPAMISAEQAAGRILEGLARGRFEIDFPRRFTAVLRLVSRLPDRLRFGLLRAALGL